MENMHNTSGQERTKKGLLAKLSGKIDKRFIRITTALALVVGAVFLNYKLQKNFDKKIEQEKYKPKMIIVSDLPSYELDRRYERYAKDGVLDLRCRTEQDGQGAEYYTNKSYNKGIFIKGYSDATNKMKVPAEHKRHKSGKSKD